MGGRGGSGRSGGAERGTGEGNAPTLVSQFLDAYRNLPKPGSQGWVTLADMREALPNVSRNDFDTLLKQLALARRVILIPEENQQTLTPRKRAAAFEYGGEANHVLRVE